MSCDLLVTLSVAIRRVDTRHTDVTAHSITIWRLVTKSV